MFVCVIQILEAELEPLLNVQLNSKLVYLCILGDNTIIRCLGPGLMMLAATRPLRQSIIVLFSPVGNL